MAIDNLEKLYDAIREDITLRDLAGYKLSVYEIASPRIRFYKEVGKFEIYYSDEVNEVISKVDKLIELRIGSIKKNFK
tara:strand:- start:36439 stop:36672 length:234 start_codon:yes stop_codon:yes gene_type:complete